MQRADWNNRYAAKELVWGTDPNRFAAEALADAAPDRALDLACGEGRNAIWLATLGWQVTGVDFSDVAIERATKLAGARGVEVDFRVADATEFRDEPGSRSLVVISYMQVPRDDRRAVLANAAAALAPGGRLFMIGHALRNLEDGHGGPSSPKVLWDPEALRDDVEAAGLRIERCDEVDRPFEGDDGTHVAIDTLLEAEKPA
jgi:SAM-dependent methyltransferase